MHQALRVTTHLTGRNSILTDGTKLCDSQGPYYSCTEDHILAALWLEALLLSVINTKTMFPICYGQQSISKRYIYTSEHNMHVVT